MLVTAEQARTELFCPHAEAKCRGPNCMAWRWGESRRHALVDGPLESIEQWLRENREPCVDPSDGEGIELWEEWTRLAADFTASLEPTPRPAGDGWVWGAGFDEDESRPFAHWYRPAEPRGYCGLAGPVAAPITESDIPY